MATKLTLLGLMIYAAMGLWAAALAAYLARRGRTGTALFGLGGVATAAAFVVRWVQVEHAPLQSLFEVMVCLGMMMFPLWLFARKLLGARGPASAVLLGLVVLFLAGFVFHAEQQPLPPALQSWLFIPHVAAYMLAYVILILAAAQAAMHLAGSPPGEAGSAGRASQEAPSPRLGTCEQAAFRLVCLGFPLLTLGLVLGAVWGKLAWGDYWNWDPKELWSLASWLVYVAYLHIRSRYGGRTARLNSALAILGAVLIVITLLWVNLAVAGKHTYAT